MVAACLFLGAKVEESMQKVTHIVTELMKREALQSGKDVQISDSTPVRNVLARACPCILNRSRKGTQGHGQENTVLRGPLAGYTTL